MKTSRFLSCRQAAEYLGVSVKTIRRWAQTGTLEGKKVGSRGDWRFTHEQLERLVRVQNALVSTERSPEDNKELGQNKKNEGTISADTIENTTGIHSDRYLAALTANIADAVVSLDAHHNVVSWNKGAEKLYGWKEEEVIGKRLSSLLRQKPVGNITLKDLRKIVDKEGVWRGESVHRRKDGSTVEVQTSAAAIRNEKGTMVGRVAVYRDISARKQAERQLAEKEMRYRLLFDSIVAGFCVVEALYDKKGRVYDYRFLEVNPSYEVMVGVSNMQGKTLNELSPAISEKWIDVVAEVIGSRKDIRSISYSYSTDKWYDVHVMPTGAQENRMAAILIYDVTERIKTEEERASYSQKVINTIETIDEAYIQLDSNFNVVMVNEEFLRMTKMPRENLLGYNLKDVFSGDEKMQIVNQDALSSVIKSHQPKYFSEYFYTLQKIWIKIRAYPSEEGGVSLFIRDITSRKQIEKKQVLLEQLSLERDELIKLGHIKDEFIGIASHQLRTPATGVKQYIGILLAGIGGSLTERQQKYLEEAYASNERQLKIINDLLKTAQIDAETYTLNQSSQNVSSLITNMISSMQSVFDERKQSVIVKSQSKNVRVHADPVEMDLVFSNLLENASKYSPKNSKITVIVRHDSDMLSVDIVDQGVGIRKADQQKIFDKFTRVYNEQTDVVVGSGLGLYWVKQIVEMYNGKISVTSELHKGSTFTVTLPIKHEEQGNE